MAKGLAHKSRMDSMTVKAAGRKGGMAKTPKKAKAARKNGRQGWMKVAQRSNEFIALVMDQLNSCASVCESIGAPIRSITFRVLDNGHTNTRVTYRRPKK